MNLAGRGSALNSLHVQLGGTTGEEFLNQEPGAFYWAVGTPVSPSLGGRGDTLLEYKQTHPWGRGGRGAVGGRGRKSLGFSLTWNVNKWSREIDLHPSGAMYLPPLPSKAYFLFTFLLYYFFLLRCSCCAPRHLFYPVILESIRPVLFAVNTWIVQKYENVPGELCLNTCHSFYYLRFEYEWKTKDYQECY